jgi:hypothetical protein
VTVDDPKAYTRPWTVKLNHFVALDTDLLDYFCLENEKDVVRLVGKEQSGQILAPGRTSITEER